MHNASTRRYPLRRRSSPRLEHEGDRVTSVESGSGGESMFEHLAIELLRDSLEQLGLGTPHRWPGPQSGKLPQPVGRTQGQRGLQRAIQVVANRDDPGDGQLRSALEIRIVDALLESLETLERDQGAVVVTNLDGGNGRYQ